MVAAFVVAVMAVRTCDGDRAVVALDADGAALALCGGAAEMLGGGATLTDAVADCCALIASC